MYYVGLDVHKKTISYCAKDASGRILPEGKMGATSLELDRWMRTLPRPWTVAIEATIFTGWIYDHLLPHAAAVRGRTPGCATGHSGAKKKKKNDRIDAAIQLGCLRDEPLVMHPKPECQSQQKNAEYECICTDP